MVNKLMALVLCLVLLVCVLPVTGLAATNTEKEELKTAARDSYVKSQESAGKESFNGFCGMMVSHQLWHIGINPGLLSANGNEQYDLYSTMTRTGAGYYICSYSAEEYTLEKALNVISRNGTKDVYNLLVGFEWTNTPSGEEYGHAVVINAILDGKVYFVESFYTALGGEEGNVVVCTIPEFAAMFENWSLFEGVIHFAGKTYADACKEYPTDLFVRARFAMELRSQPCLVGKNGSKIQRSVSAGERLRVTALLKNPNGEWYYRVEDGDQVGYLVADTVVLARTNAEDITIGDFKLELPTKEDEDLQMTGRIQAQNGLVGAVEMVIADATGNEVFRYREITDAFRVNLKDLNEKVAFPALDDGVYTVTVCADTASAYIVQGKLDYSDETILLHQETLLVGEIAEAPQPKTAESPEVKNGWYWTDGVWYFYKEGLPQTGWICENGVWYYLQEDGSVTTGQAQVGDNTYYFTDTGAMCVGWVNTGRGLRYTLKDGTVATGWQMINGSRYFFEEDGTMAKRGTKMDGEVKYQIRSDGRAVKMVDRRLK